MTPVKIFHVSAAVALELKYQLIANGLIIGQDFEWLYHQAEYDNFSNHAVIPRHVEFRFRDPVLATYYQLKWQ